MNKTKIKKYSKKVLNFTKDNVWELVGVGLGVILLSEGYYVGYKVGSRNNKNIPNE